MKKVTTLEPGRSGAKYWSEMWEFRELFATLAWKDLAVRYKQTVVGVAWAVVRPLLSMLIFTIIFGRVANLPSDGTAPYPIMVFAAMLPWFLFATILGDASNSLVANKNMIAKVYFPRMIIPLSSTLVSIVDLAISFALLLLLMFYFGFYPDWRILFLPFFVVLGALTAIGPALLMTALNVKYRDFRFIIPFVVQFGLYISPVGFSSSVVPDQWQLLYSINPMVGVIDGFRWCTLAGQADLNPVGLCISLLIVVANLWLGVAYFRKTERTFADVI